MASGDLPHGEKEGALSTADVWAEYRAHFLALAARVMRNLLIDQDRARRAAKRGAGVAPVELAAVDIATVESRVISRALPLSGSIAQNGAALAEQIGHDIVTASGTTLLGADDKAGVAIVMAAARHLISNPDIQHGPVRICFTPDEEIGRGVHPSLPVKTIKELIALAKSKRGDLSYGSSGSGAINHLTGAPQMKEETR